MPDITLLTPRRANHHLKPIPIEDILIMILHLKAGLQSGLLLSLLTLLSAL